MLRTLADLRFRSTIAIGAVLLLLGAILFSASAFAAPLTATAAGATVTLQLTPDPPMIGKTHGIVTLSGVSPDVLAHTTASFATLMPSMSMGGPRGVLKMTAPGQYAFDAMLGMAAAWDIDLKFSGGLIGVAVFHITVNNGAPSAGASAPSTAGQLSPSDGSIAGMSSSGDPAAWRTATFALIGILIIGLFAVLRVRRDRRPLTLGITVAAALIALLLAVVQARFAAPAMDMAAMSSVQGDAPVPVTVVVVRSGGGRDSIYAPGSIAPYLTQDVVTRAAGILRDFNAYAGDRVAAGQTIATLDAPDIYSQAAAAQADAHAQQASAVAAEIEAHHHAPNGVIIANAQAASTQDDLAAARSDASAKAEQLRYWQDELWREKSLLDQGAVSQQEYADERAQSAAAQAAHDGATQRVASLEQQVVGMRVKALDAAASVGQMQAQALSARAGASRAESVARTQTILASYTNVTSPSDATVVKRLIDPGVYVQAGTAIARIAVLDRLRLQANVAQGDLIGLSAGTPVEATLANGSVVHGRVTSVSPVADPTTHTAAVEAIVANAAAHFIPGGYVRVTLHPANRRDSHGLQVPLSAIVGSGAQSAVWVNAGGVAQRVPVTVISDDGVSATVTGNLKAGTRVVVQGAPTLEDGQAITEVRT